MIQQRKRMGKMMSLETKGWAGKAGSSYNVRQYTCTRGHTSPRWHTPEDLASSLDREGGKSRV